jgi:hypothetical protein
MTDTTSAVLGLVIVGAIVLVAWRLARQARRQSEDAYATEVTGVPGSKVESVNQPGMSVTDQTVHAQHTSTGVAWNVASHAGDGST